MSRSQLTYETLCKAVFENLQFPEGTEASGLSLLLSNRAKVAPGQSCDILFRGAVPEPIDVVGSIIVYIAGLGQWLNISHVVDAGGTCRGDLQGRYVPALMVRAQRNSRRLCTRLNTYFFSLQERRSFFFFF